MPPKVIPLSCLLLLLASAVAAQAQPAAPADLETKATAMLDALVRGDFEGATRDFDARMLEALPPAKMQELWTTLVAQVGSFQKQAGVRTEEIGGHPGVFVTAVFERMSLDMLVSFDAAGKAAGLFFRPAKEAPPAGGPDAGPPPYAKKEAFEEKEVTVGSEWPLPGTLTLPVGPGPFPAVVLVHGSGPNDRDESYGPNKVFRDLAWGLASRGIAVLRYDKRTRVHADRIGTVPRFTVQVETVDDAVAAVALLRRTEKIDPQRIHVLGHSLGGYLIPRIGKADPRIAGLIVLAGSARQMSESILDQVLYFASLDGTVSEEEKKQIDFAKEQVRKISELKEGSSEVYVGVPPSYWIDLQGYNPAEAAKPLPQPLFILHAERDFQVFQTDFDLWKKALASRKDVTFKSYPKLNHHFIAGEGKGTMEEYDKPGHVAQEVVEDIVGWILKRPGDGG